MGKKLDIPEGGVAEVVVPDEPAGLSALDTLQREQDLEAEALVNATETSAAQTASQQAQGEAEQAAARAGAAFAVGFLESVVKMRAPYVVFGDEQKEQVVEKTAAVLAKHGGGMPEWLVPYREELELGIVLASAGFGVYVQIQTHNAAEAEAHEKARQAEAERRRQQSGHVDLTQGN